MKILSHFIMAALVVASFPVLAQAQKPPEKGAQPVIVIRVAEDEFADHVEALGTLRANETVTLTATVTETVTAINFDDNARVEAGDILVEMTSTQEAAELDAEQATVDEALQQVERIEPLIKSGAASKSLLDERRRDYETAKARLEAIKSRIADRIITAPFAGVVGLRNISVGAVLQPGMRITTLDDDSIMKLDFSVPSVFLSAIEPGIEIVATSRSFPNHKFKGKIASIDSQIDPVTRSIAVRALIHNEEKLLRPGLLMSLDILKNPRTAIVIPEEAIVPEARKNFVFIVQKAEKGTAVKKQEVTIGARRSGEVEILKGLEIGDVVVTHGTLNLGDGAAVKITTEDKGNEPLKDMLQAGQKAQEKTQQPKAQ